VFLDPLREGSVLWFSLSLQTLLLNTMQNCHMYEFLFFIDFVLRCYQCCQADLKLQGSSNLSASASRWITGVYHHSQLIISLKYYLTVTYQ
jgi:hypothetical protein